MIGALSFEEIEATQAVGFFDLDVEATLDILHTLTYEQQLQLLDRLGIDYSAYAAAEAVIEAETKVISSFADLF